MAIKRKGISLLIRLWKLELLRLVGSVILNNYAVSHSYSMIRQIPGICNM